MRIVQKFSKVRGFAIHVDRRQSSAESGISKGDCCKYRKPHMFPSYIFTMRFIDITNLMLNFRGVGMGGRKLMHQESLKIRG